MSTTKEKQGTTAAADDAIIASIVINGDTSKLTQQQKVDYYRMFCERVGLDPLSQPFKLMKLNGRETLYCDRTGAQQLNKVHNVSHEIKARETFNGCYVVTAQASTPNGRRTESIGAVPIENQKGDALCNAMMKAETKAKRRATLDLLGLGILDETETETLNGKIEPVPLAATNLHQAAAQDITPAVVATEVNSTGMADKMKPFKRKYETVAEVTSILKDTREIKEVASLYYVNSELIEATPDLKAEFTNRKNQLYNSHLSGITPHTISEADAAYMDAVRQALGDILLQKSLKTLDIYMKTLDPVVNAAPDVMVAYQNQKKTFQNN